MVLIIIYEVLIKSEERKDYFNEFIKVLEILKLIKEKYVEVEEK